jgi:hypothetical protein
VNLFGMLEGWSFRTFAGKYLRRGLRVGVTFVVGRLSLYWTAAHFPSDAVNWQVVEGCIDMAIWTKVELWASILKTKAAASEKYKWVGNFL